MRNLQNEYVPHKERTKPSSNGQCTYITCHMQIEYKNRGSQIFGHYFLMPPRQGKVTKHAAKVNVRARKQASATCIYYDWHIRAHQDMFSED